MDNAVELDAAARALTVQHSDDPSEKLHAPFMISFDIAAAFPSIDRRAVPRALRSAGAPQAMLNICRGNHSARIGVLFPGGDITRPAFEATAGVTQGCPLSPILYTIAAEALLNMLERTVGDLESSQAFADDVAVLVRHLRGLAKLVSPFRAWRRATGLKLQHTKI